MPRAHAMTDATTDTTVTMMKTIFFLSIAAVSFLYLRGQQDSVGGFKISPRGRAFQGFVTGFYDEGFKMRVFNALFVPAEIGAGLAA